MRENEWQRIEAGTVMRARGGGKWERRKVGGRKKLQGEREEPRGLSREGVAATHGAK